MDSEKELNLIKKLLHTQPGDIDYYKFQKDFENRAQLYKSRLWSISSWLIGFQVALVFGVFSLDYVGYKENEITVSAIEPVIFSFILEIALFVFSALFIQKMNRHIKRNEYRANLILNHVEVWRGWKKAHEDNENESSVDDLIAKEKIEKNGYFQSMLQWFSLSVLFVHVLVFLYLLYVWCTI